MDTIGRLLRKAWFLLLRKRFNSELDEEMAFHRSLAEQGFQADGMTLEHAIRSIRISER